MTLNRQLWVVIAALITLTFASGFIVSSYTARNYFLEQLSIKNIDNAASLALSLSQMDKDPINIELMISAQFDTGHYERIVLIGPNGEILQRREQLDPSSTVPAWFERMMAFEVPPGIAQVQDGWFQFGTLQVESQSAFAMEALWRVFYQLMGWFLTIALLFGALGSLVLRRISQPLQAVVEQAEALGERRFITSKEPRTLEFMRLVRAMNKLTQRVRVMLETEARRLDEIRQHSQLDPATGVSNREHFLRLLSARLSLSDHSVKDGILLLRITNLTALNARLGHAATDEWIGDLIERLQAVLDAASYRYSQYAIGRLNGSDFAILVNDTDFLEELIAAVWDSVTDFAEESDLYAEQPLALVGSYFHPAHPRSELFAQLDSLLASAEQAPAWKPLVAVDARQPPLYPDAKAWRTALETALAEHAIAHVCFPVLDTKGGVYHEEAMLRIRLGQRELSAGAVIGWARRLNLLPQLDLKIVEGVLADLGAHPERRIAVNISVETLRQASSYLQLLDLIERQGRDLTGRLSIEINEQVAFQHHGLVASFSAAVKGRGVLLGLQSAGKNIQAIPGLEKLGLDYLKVDAALVQLPGDNVRDLLRGLCKLGQSLGLVIIAEGVLEGTDQAALIELGFDGFTGPGVRVD